MQQAVAALLIAFLAAACAAPPRPNVVIIVIDTLRADRLGSYGNRRGLTPFLDGIAAESLLFERAYSTSSWTCPAVASLFTSRYPSQHRVVTFDSVLAEQERTLAERLGDLGYRTAGFSANFRLMAKLGYAQGFDHWQSYFAPATKPRASLLAPDVLRWVEEQDPAAPAFLYLHYMEPHSPYRPPREFRRKFALPIDRHRLSPRLNQLLMSFQWEELDESRVDRLRALYDAEVASLDAEIASLFAELERRKFLDGAIVVVTSDHGEEFREHDLLLHGITLFEESVRVPLFIRLPERAGRRVVQPVSLLDVMPTLLELLGAEADPDFEGRSLADAGRRDLPMRKLRLELLPSGVPEETRTHSGGWLDLPHKLLVEWDDRQYVAYDLASDPAEQQPLGAEHADAIDALRTAYDANGVELLERSNADAETVPLDEETREKLRAIGYAN